MSNRAIAFLVWVFKFIANIWLLSINTIWDITELFGDSTFIFPIILHRCYCDFGNAAYCTRSSDKYVHYFNQCQLIIISMAEVLLIGRWKCWHTGNHSRAPVIQPIKIFINKVAPVSKIAYLTPIGIPVSKVALLLSIMICNALLCCMTTFVSTENCLCYAKKVKQYSTYSFMHLHTSGTFSRGNVTRVFCKV